MEEEVLRLLKEDVAALSDRSRAALVSQLRKCGSLQRLTEEFFTKSKEDKQRYAMDLHPFDKPEEGAENPLEEGYVPLFDYEFYQVRALTSNASENEGASFHERWCQAFTFLYSLGVTFLEGIDVEYRQDTQMTLRLSSMLDPHSKSDSQAHLSSSLLRTIHYYNKPERAQEDNVVFPEHTDIGLITIIPLLPTTFPGLQLLNKDTLEWYPVEERLCKPTCEGVDEDEDDDLLLLVFGGETLQHATNGFISAATHRVVLPPASPSTSNEPLGRRSIQLFLRANSKAPIHSLDGRSMCTVGQWEREWEATQMK